MVFIAFLATFPWWAYGIVGSENYATCKFVHRRGMIFLGYLNTAATNKLPGSNYIYRNLLAVINITEKTFLFRVEVLQILQLTYSSINPRFDPGVHSCGSRYRKPRFHVRNILSCMRTGLPSLPSTLRSEQKGTGLTAEISLCFFYDDVDLHLTSTNLSFILRWVSLYKFSGERYV